MTPIEYYHEYCQQGLITEDPQQLMAIRALQRVYDDLQHELKKRASHFSVLRKPKLVHGVYLWGSVGIGKTFLMDCFYHCLPFSNKMRLHFHVFMREIHRQLKKYQGEKDPLQIIAKNIAREAIVLCFDELIVDDIVDAMLLGRLFKALFSHGVTIITTSNTEPDNLYRRGLQREQFLPAIALIKKHLDVLHLTTTIDYRERHLHSGATFYMPHDEMAVENMEKDFALLTAGLTPHFEPISLCDRTVPIVKQAGDVIWFDFDVLCHPPRSQQDYLAIAEQYKTVLLSDIPVIPAANNNIITLFIRLVDVLYDARVRLIFSAADYLEKLYPEGELLFSYARTRSRLIEMQSRAWQTR